MADELAPLTPADCDLSDFQYMELDVRRLRDSKFAASSDGEAFRAGILLWCAAWHQIPAASLPDDDIELANLSGYGRIAREWKKVRTTALHGFVKCSDGRLYHPVIAEKALAAYHAKHRHAWEKCCDRLRKENYKREKAKQLSVGIPTFEQWKAGMGHQGIPPEGSEDSEGIPPENALRGNREGTEREQNGEGTERTRDLLSIAGGSSTPPAPQPKSRKSAAAKKPDPPTAGTWKAYAAAYENRYGEPPVRNAKVNGQLANVVSRLGASEAPAVAAFFVRSQNARYVGTGHSVGMLLTDAEKLRTEWATGRQGTATQAVQADRTQTNFNAFAPLLAEAKAREKLNGKH